MRDSSNKRNKRSKRKREENRIIKEREREEGKRKKKPKESESDKERGGEKKRIYQYIALIQFFLKYLRPPILPS